MQLFLQPDDVWLFRDGRAFDAGSDHRAVSLFPPQPSVVQGAIRTRQLAHLNVDLRDRAAIIAAVGTADDVRELRLRGPFLAVDDGARVRRYFPQPADARSTDTQQHRIKRASAPATLPEGVQSSAPTTKLLGFDDPQAKGESGLWLDEQALERYQAGEEVEATPAAQLFVTESRVGIGMDRQRRLAAEGALFEVEFVRPLPGVGLLVEVRGYAGWPAEGMLRLGGEARTSAFRQVEVEPWPAPPNPLPARFTLYFATPTYFARGWRPADWGTFFEGPVDLVAAALNRYESVGGFDVAAGQEKPARRFVPAGSTYYFETPGEESARLRPGLIQGAVTEFGAEIGFGQIRVQRWA